jgi:hypothetical protein
MAERGEAACLAPAITRFVRYEVGEGIEKGATKDFATEGGGDGRQGRLIASLLPAVASHRLDSLPPP